MKALKINLTAEKLAEKKQQLRNNIEQLKGKEGFEGMVAGFEAELAEYEELEQTSKGVDRKALFAELFGDYAFNPADFNEKQLEFLGEKGIQLLLKPDGTFEYSGKSGATGGTKKPMPYSGFKVPVFNADTEAEIAYKDVKSASDAVDLVREYLKTGGIADLKVSEGNSMRRELVKLNKEHKVGVIAIDKETKAEYALIDSPHETAAAAEDEGEEENNEVITE